MGVDDDDEDSALFYNDLMPMVVSIRCTFYVITLLSCSDYSVWICHVVDYFISFGATDTIQFEGQITVSDEAVSG